MLCPGLRSILLRLAFKHGKNASQSSCSNGLAPAFQANGLHYQTNRLRSTTYLSVRTSDLRSRLSAWYSHFCYVRASHPSSEGALGSVFKVFFGSSLRFNQFCSSTPDEIRLIDEHGRNVGIVKFADAQQQAEEKGYELRLVGHTGQKSDVATYRLTAATSPEEQHKEKAKVKKEKVKEVIFKTGIGQQDLQWKTKHITDFLADDQRVRVVIKKKFRSTLPADETMDKLMERLKDVAVLDGAVKSLPNGLAFKLRPKKR